MSIGYTPGRDEEAKIKILDDTLKSLNRPDILIENAKASTQSFQEYVKKRRRTGEDKSIDLFDPLSQSNSNLRNIEDLYDIVIPDKKQEDEDLNNAARYRHIFNM